MSKHGFAALFFVTAAAIFAQVERASIIGNVTDATGAAAPGVTVTVTNEGTNTSVVLTTDDVGAYTAVNLIPGVLPGERHPKRVQTDGLPQFRAPGGTERASRHHAWKWAMSSRRWRSPARFRCSKPKTPSVGQVIDAEAVNALPLNGRNFVQLAILAPGVSGLDYAQAGTINTGKRPDELRPGARQSRSMEA